MARIKVLFDGQVKQELELNSSEDYLVGRAQNSQIVLDHPEISRQHLRFKFVDGKWMLEVLSKYGRVLVNGYPAERVPLENGAKLTVSPFLIIFEDGEAIQNFNLQAGAPSPSDEEALSESPEKTSLADGSDKTFVGENLIKIGLVRIDLSDTIVEDIPLTSTGTFFAGRSRHSQVQLKDLKASRKHFTIEFDGTHYVLRDLGTPNKTFVNGVPVTEHVLRNGDEIAVGSDRFRFVMINTAFENLPAALEAPQTENPNTAPQNQSAGPAVIRVSTPGRIGKSWALEDFGIPHEAFFKNKSVQKVLIAAFAVIGLYSLLKPAPKPLQQQQLASTKTGSAQRAPLTPEQQKYLEDTYNLALNLYTSGKYDLAALEIAKIFQVVPDYKDAKNIQALCQQSLEIRKQQDEMARRKRDQDELSAKVNGILDECEKLLAQKRYSEVQTCVGRTTELDPENERGKSILMSADSQIETMESNRISRAVAARAKSSAQKTYEAAMKALQEKRYPAAIQQFQRVTAMAFNDTDGIKPKAKLGLKNAKEKILERSQVLVREARTALSAKNYKSALQKLNEALKISPDNGDARIIKDHTTDELHTELKNIYSESVIEENLGNVEAAKKKWETILEMGVTSDSYYDKAKSKLSKYNK